MRSITVTDLDSKAWTEFPEWARYVVAYVHPLRHPQPEGVPGSVYQVFMSRPAAERWARTLAKSLPARSCTEVGFVLVYAMGPRPMPGRALRSTMGEAAIAYRAIDGGGHVVKDHPIPAGYGVPQLKSCTPDHLRSRITPHACTACEARLCSFNLE
jgi:hypothetical protein